MLYTYTATHTIVVAAVVLTPNEMKRRERRRRIRSENIKKKNMIDNKWHAKIISGRIHCCGTKHKQHLFCSSTYVRCVCEEVERKKKKHK